MQVLAPLPIGFAVFMVHLATIPITGTGINPARSFGAAVIYGHKHSWDDQVNILSSYSSISINLPAQTDLILILCERLGIKIKKN